jgi:hypothetical protein
MVFLIFDRAKALISCCIVLHPLQLISKEFQRGAAAPRDMKRDMANG